jgi:hypothetical protein
MPNYAFIELAPRKEAKILVDYTSIEYDLSRHSPDSGSVGCDPPSLGALRQQNFARGPSGNSRKGGLVGFEALKLSALP